MKALASAVRAVASGLLAWVLIQSLLFALVHSAPGGPAAALAGDYATRETQAAVSARFALDQPVPQQFVSFVTRMAQGDWGFSYHFRRPVAALIAERIVPTLLLMLGALGIALVAGRALGLWAATHEPEVSSGVECVKTLPTLRICRVGNVGDLSIMIVYI